MLSKQPPAMGKRNGASYWSELLCMLITVACPTHSSPNLLIFTAHLIYLFCILHLITWV